MSNLSLLRNYYTFKIFKQLSYKININIYSSVSNIIIINSKNHIKITMKFILQ